ncbi:ABC transporter ATP-binding protein [uncultured Lactobacillus sp.]|uniref:ABC transporter ATP-binding protein n=1 Tax=uncultured Lactobacillus sp. TaxID=153152 RepID=UPI00260866D8|nr:ABC transporter ATP-binding protein [uncultured Lactobacillus sp.]
MPSNTQNNSDQKTKFNFHSFVYLINSVHPHYWRLVLGIFLGIIATAANLIVPQLAKDFVNDFNHITATLVTLLIVLFISGTVLSALAGVVLGIFGEDVVAKLRNQLWKKYLHLPVVYFDDTQTGEISSRLVNDTSQVKNLLANTLPNSITSILQFFGSLVIMITMDWQMTLIIFLAVPLITLALRPVLKRSIKIGLARQDALAKFSSNATNVLSEIRLVKSSNSEKIESANGDKEIHTLYEIGMREAMLNSIMIPLMNMVMMVLFLGLLGYGAIRVMNHSLSMGALISFLMYLFQLLAPVFTISQFFNELSKTSGSTKRIEQVLQIDNEKSSASKKPDIEGQALKAENVSFSYEEGNQILHNINLEVKPNTIVAFAGPSGGGKSTIFSLIERFYKPTSGKIVIGSTNIDEIDLTYWRNQIGLVGQDSPMMPGTIRQNLTYGLTRKVTEKELWHVLKMAYADGFVSEMQNQLETEIGERGIKLSGGQRQRIAIARAFLRDPDILMLDEATASLDSESEAMVQKALGELMKNRMTLVIAHRLSTIVDADCIYFIDHGTVSGHGTHKELIKSTPLYAEYVHTQFKE